MASKLYADILISAILETVFLDVTGLENVPYPIHLGPEAMLAQAGLRLERTVDKIDVFFNDTWLVSITVLEYGEYISIIINPAALVLRALSLIGQQPNIQKRERYKKL